MSTGIAVAAASGILLAASIAPAGETKGSREQCTGTLRVSGRPSKHELTKMSKSSMAVAENAALAAVEAKDADKRIRRRELEVERGYLIYSFDVSVTGRKGVEEIIVDARNAKVLAHERE